ncbi:MAG TPA: hypothetical protein VFQ59_03395 [Candidatus Paceibacterota bacterium]|nr:hypothetical protein [Candidatus Paceibacterota bacterium]
MTEILSVLVSIIFFVNKILILIERKSGWLVGAIAAALALIYFILIELLIFTVLEFGLVILMAYGFFFNNRKNLYIEKLIHLTIVCVMTVLASLAFTGMMTIYEFVSAVLMLFGTYYLTHNKEALGWLLYGLAHLFAAYVTIEKNQQFFADFQIASAIVSAIGFCLKIKEK